MSQFMTVRNSSIEGKGAFANRNFAVGEVISVFEGVPAHFREEEKKFLHGDPRVTCDNFQVGLETYITLDEVHSALNHSCNPSAAVDRLRQLVAVEPIREGSEITFDYSTVEWTPQAYVHYDTNKWPMRCHCGSAHCRGLITCFPYLPRELREQYARRGLLQEFIVTKMTWPRDKQRCAICEEKIALHQRFHSMNQATSV